MKRISTILSIVIFYFILTSIFSQNSENNNKKKTKKHIKIEFNLNKKAIYYHIQWIKNKNSISSESNIDKVVTSPVIKKININIHFFRIRSIGANNQIGKWSKLFIIPKLAKVNIKKNNNSKKSVKIKKIEKKIEVKNKTLTSTSKAIIYNYKIYDNKIYWLNKKSKITFFKSKKYFKIKNIFYRFIKKNQVKNTTKQHPKFKKFIKEINITTLMINKKQQYIFQYYSIDENNNKEPVKSLIIGINKI